MGGREGKGRGGDEWRGEERREVRLGEVGLRRGREEKGRSWFVRGEFSCLCVLWKFIGILVGMGCVLWGWVGSPASAKNLHPHVKDFFSSFVLSHCRISFIVTGRSLPVSCHLTPPPPSRD